MEIDEALVRRARDGSREAFEELVRRTTRMVYAKLYLETGDPHLAEDLVQETFLRAFRSIGHLTDPKGFRAWLMTIGQSVLIDSYRRAGAIRRSPPPRASQPRPAAQSENTSPPTTSAVASPSRWVFGLE